MRGPGDAHRAGDEARHAEAEEGAGGEELVAPPAVELEDGHMGCGAEDVEEHEDAGDGDVGGVVGEAAYARGGRCIRRALCLLLGLCWCYMRNARCQEHIG